MRKKILLLIFGVFLTLMLTGCEEIEYTGTMTTYTSVYPTEYILDNLYGKNMAIYSIYPDGTNYTNYKLTNKQLEDYSKADIYIYTGIIKNEKNYAVKMLNKNKKLKVIDSTLGMNITNNTEESWLNPSNYLMMASNIKKGLEEYIYETIEINKIDKNYEELKLKLSKIDAELKQIATDSNNPTIVVSSDTFKYLEKYGFTVISLEENENLTDKVLSEVKNLLSNKQITYIFMKDNEKENNTIKSLKEKYEFTTVRLNTLSSLSAQQRKDKKDYESIMMDNINSIKLEVIK